MRCQLIYIALPFFLIGCLSTPDDREFPSPSNEYRGFLISDGSLSGIQKSMMYRCRNYDGLDFSSIKKEEIEEWGALDRAFFSAFSYRCNAYSNLIKEKDEAEARKIKDKIESIKHEIKENSTKKIEEVNTNQLDKNKIPISIDEQIENVQNKKVECKELGFKEGSKKFKDCVVELME